MVAADRRGARPPDIRRIRRSTGLFIHGVAQYDEVVERTLLSNTFLYFFTNTLALLLPLTYRTARRVFIDLLSSAEAYFFTESV